MIREYLMGLLVNGKWRDGWFETDSVSGTFIRPDSQFRDWIEADPGSRFPAESGRYHLYVSLACPWAHRALIYRRLKGLEEAVSLSVVDPVFRNGDWYFSEGPGCIPDTVNHCTFLHEIYTRAKPDYSGIVTVPTLWDTKTNTIVNNESSEIIRMFDEAFQSLSGRPGEMVPESKRSDIEEWNDLIYHTINNGVYKAGFAETQAGYEREVRALFASLDRLEAHLAGSRYLVGDQPTEADWRLFPTLVRFDAVYHGHFKCNLRRIIDYPNLWAYTRDLYQVPGVGDTVNMEHIKRHYYLSHTGINPTGIVPAGPQLDFLEPHGRG